MSKMQSPAGVPSTPSSYPNMLCNGMQALQLSTNGEPKFLHYCYVCNTQLNSCKQALLHCSGKRHRKKLQFLQSRRTPVATSFGNATSLPAADHSPPTARALYHPHSMNTFPMSMHPNSIAVDVFPVPPPPPSLRASLGPQMYMPPQPVTPAQPCYRQLPGAPSPASWYHHQVPPGYPSFGAHPPGHFASAISHQQQMQVAMAGPFCITTTMSAGAVRPELSHSQHCESSGSSPLFLTDGSYGSAPSSSSLMSPSDTSSISSESHVQHRCAACKRQYGTLAQLQVHLQTSGHFAQMDHFQTGDKHVARLEHDCTSMTELVAIHDGEKHKQRCGTSQRAVVHSRSSSTSSEPSKDIVGDSDYASGSGDEIIRMVQGNADQPIARFHCLRCNVFLNSAAQATQHAASQKHRTSLKRAGAASESSAPTMRNGNGVNDNNNNLSTSSSSLDVTSTGAELARGPVGGCGSKLVRRRTLGSCRKQRHPAAAGTAPTAMTLMSSAGGSSEVNGAGTDAVGAARSSAASTPTFGVGVSASSSARSHEDDDGDSCMTTTSTIVLVVLADDLPSNASADEN